MDLGVAPENDRADQVFDIADDDDAERLWDVSETLLAAA
jgi:hypothetical protein